MFHNYTKINHSLQLFLYIISYSNRLFYVVGQLQEVFLHLYVFLRHFVLTLVMPVGLNIEINKPHSMRGVTASKARSLGFLVFSNMQARRQPGHLLSTIKKTNREEQLCRPNMVGQCTEKTTVGSPEEGFINPMQVWLVSRLYHYSSGTHC